MPQSSDSTRDLSQELQDAQQLLGAGEYDLARQHADKMLRQNKDEPNALFILGAAQCGLKNYQDSVKILQQLIRQHPQFSLAFQELGLALYRLNKTTQAIATLRQALTLDPSLHLSWQMLGDISQQVGDTMGAEQAYNYLLHTAKYPKVKEALYLFSKGNVDASETLCRKHLQQFPADVNAIRLLAEIAMSIGATEDAERLFERCLSLEPMYHHARLNYAHLLKLIGNYKLAYQQITLLEKEQPEQIAHLYAKAELLTLQNDHQSAILVFDDLLRKLPGDPNLLINRGHVLRSLGRQQETIDSYRQAIKSSTIHGEAYWSLANLKTFRFDDNEIEAMKKLLTANNLSKHDSAHVNFALGKAFEDDEKYKESFTYYQKGNAIKHQLEPYNPSATHHMYQRIIASHDKELLSNKKLGCQSSAPIFIIGLQRSGSTLLEQILASHSQVDGTKELPDIQVMVSKFRHGRLDGAQVNNSSSTYPEILRELSEVELLNLGNEYIERTQHHRGKAPFFIDKMPNNFMHIGFIKRILPNAKIIDARRNPIATCFSCYKQMFPAGQTFTYDQKDLGHYYLDYIQIMKHWDDVLPGEILRVNYEDVIDDFESQVIRLLEFCGLPFEDQCMEFYKTKRTAQSASSEQVRKPINRDGLNAWKPYEKELQPLIKILSSLSE